MALNLNKGNNDEKSSVPSSEKKGLNLSKTDISSKSNLNLTKEKEIYIETDNRYETVNAITEKKKIPFLVVVIAIILLGVGIFLYINKYNSNQRTTGLSVNNNKFHKTTPSESNASLIEQKNTESKYATQDSNVVIKNPPHNTNKPSETSTVYVNSNTTTSSLNSSPDSNQSSSTNSPSPSLSVSSSKSTEDKVRQVISGAFGNGTDRKKALGTEYAAIQAKVNEIYRNKLQ